MANVKTIGSSAMELAILEGGSVLHHPRNANGDVTGHGAPITTLEGLPSEASLVVGTDGEDAVLASLEARQAEINNNIALIKNARAEAGKPKKAEALAVTPGA